MAPQTFDQRRPHMMPESIPVHKIHIGAVKGEDGKYRGGDRKDVCYVCGRHTHTQTHHCLHGGRRKRADAFGLTVQLCPTCHANLHNYGDYDLELEREAQANFEEVYKDKYGKEYAHEAWMVLFGKDYGEEE